MDVQDQTTHTSPSGHDGHHGGICHRCGWPYPNSHPSAKHRRAHKKICGTIEGYTNLIGSEVVSDDEHHSDDDKEHTPSIDVSEKTDPHVEKIEETEIKTESNHELTRSIDVSEPQEAKSIDVTVVEKGQESQTSDTVTEEAKDSEITKTTPEVSAIGDERVEKVESVTTDGIKSDCENVSEAVKESEIVEEIKIEKSELDHEIDPEVSKIDNVGGVGEEIKHEKLESDHKHVPEVSKESEIVQTVSILNEEQIQEVVKEPVEVLTEKKDLETPALEKSSIEQIQEVVKEPDTVLTEKEDLGGPHLEKPSNEHTHEDVKKPESILTENVVEEIDLVSNGKEDLGLHKSEECSKDEVIEQKVDNGSNRVADVSTETITSKDLSDDSIIKSKNGSVVVPESVVEESNGKLKNNEDSGADLSSPNSLEGTWGSVSVLSTASIDAETTEKSKVNSEKSNAATTDVFEHPSFMTLVEPKNKDNKSGSSEPQPDSEPSQAGWFPTLTKVNNESEGRKKNEEVMAKVANVGSGKQSTPLKNLLGEARSPSGKQLEPVVQKDEAAVNPPVNDDVSSPPKLIEDGQKGKKGKGRSLWVPFMCCSSVNAVK